MEDADEQLWRRLELIHRTDGYRTGLIQGKDDAQRDAFADGYRQACEKLCYVSRLKGTIRALHGYSIKNRFLSPELNESVKCLLDDVAKLEEHCSLVTDDSISSSSTKDVSLKNQKLNPITAAVTISSEIVTDKAVLQSQGIDCTRPNAAQLHNPIPGITAMAVITSLNLELMDRFSEEDVLAYNLVVGQIKELLSFVDGCARHS